ncbi:MAG: class I SAM-dependent methyltransferase [Candidatus Nanopelagicales bacterium]|nr:class I SAM-dependent methyltransferase [Candidatus Nanopelagicales bacterium]
MPKDGPAADPPGATPGVTIAALLTVLARVSGATSVVEVGTGEGETGSALLTGMGEGGTLTSIDFDPSVQRTARERLNVAAGGNTPQVRLIAGTAREVLTRLADDAYDLIVVNKSDEDCAIYLENALRLLRVGGMLVLTDATRDGTVIDPANRGVPESAMRETLKAARENEQLAAVLLPFAGGVLLAVRLV